MNMHSGVGTAGAAAARRPTKLDKELLRQKRFSDLKMYGCVLALAGGMLLILFISRGIWPFGEKMLQFTDGDQYFSFLGYLQSTFFTGSDLLYSWSTTLGGNMLPSYAYYAASPFNLLAVFFPGNLVAAYHFIYILKVLAAGVCFTVMLQGIWPQAEMKVKVLFGASYPFIGFMSYFAWNQSWMDGVILLPLIALGIWHLVVSCKPLLYCISLALALLSNYYIGYMLCIASVLLFVSCLVLARKRAGVELLWILVWYVSASLMAAALAAIVLLPVFESLPEDRAKPLGELLEQAEYSSAPARVLSMLYTASFRDMQFADNYPVIYTGIVQLVLAVTFFLNKQIPRRQKAVAAALLAVFMASFCISVLNRMWHGFTENVWYNFRYSFLVSFVLEIMAFCSFLRMEGARSRLLAAAAVMAAITVFAIGPDTENVGPLTLLVDLLFIGAALLLLYLYAGDKPQKPESSRIRQIAVFSLIGLITFWSLGYNSYRALEGTGDWDQARDGLQDVSTYADALEMHKQAQEVMAEDGLWRQASTQRYSRMDPMLFGYAGMENFASTEQKAALDAASRFGARRTWTWGTQYNTNIPIASEALLGIRYIATGDDNKADWYDPVTHIAEQEDITVWEDPYALPLLFEAQSRCEPSEDLNNMEYINACWSSVTQEGGDIFLQAPSNAEVQGNDVYVHFWVNDPGPVYAYIPDGFSGLEVPRFAWGQNMYWLGNFAAGDEGDFVVRSEDGYSGTDRLAVYTERMDVLQAKAAAVQDQGIQVQTEGSSHLRVTLSGSSGGLIASTIPFDEGWHVSADGSALETFQNMDAFLAFEIPAGTREIELAYSPPGFAAGAVVSAIALAALLAWIFRRRIMGWHLRTLAAERPNASRDKAGMPDVQNPAARHS